jgi:DNA-binding NarL/FixJ family response regulator
LADAPRVVRDVVVLADDLIWGTRLAEAITAAGARPKPARRLADLERLLAAAAGTGGNESDGDPSTGLAIVDLTARAYDGIEAIRLAAGTGARVAAVGQHDDAALRRAAIAAGAERVYTYRALFEDGPRTLAAWLAR